MNFEEKKEEEKNVNLTTGSNESNDKFYISINCEQTGNNFFEPC